MESAQEEIKKCQTLHVDLAPEMKILSLYQMAANNAKKLSVEQESFLCLLMINLMLTAKLVVNMKQ